MARYSRPHYQDVASVIARLNLDYGIHSEHDTLLIGHAINEFVKLFKADNPAFDTFRFIEWCQDTRKAR